MTSRRAAVLGWALAAALCGCSPTDPPVQRPDAVHQPDAGARPGAQPVVLLITGSKIVAAFFDVMRDRLAKEGFQPLVFQPPDLFSESLEVGAKRIADAVQDTLAKTGRKRLSIVAECNGGVASRFYVEQLGGDEHVERFISFVSAHHGTKWAIASLYPALADITPGSAFLEKMEKNRPASLQSAVTSIYICSDEIMDPYTTSKLDGALNIEICDPELDKRARERKPYDVGDFMGLALIKLYPVHLTGFWDEPFFRLLLSSLKDDPATVKKFSELKVKFP
jgi:hypothetical protein